MVDEEFDAAGIPLGAALRALPLESPPGDAWAALAARLPRARARPRWPLALAAGLVGLMLLPWGLPQRGSEAPQVAATTTRAGDSAALAGVMAESARLERLVAALSDAGASSATAATLSLEFDDRLHALDEKLQASRDASGQLLLWRQRVQLLRNLAAVETSRHYLASEGRNLDVALVAAY